MKNFERELNNKRREFSQWFTFSILGIFLFYILLVFLIQDMGHQPFALPKSVLILGFVTAAYISFLISKTKFNFITIYRIILASILFLITYISMLLCNISKTIYLLYIPVVLMVMLLTSFRKSIYFAAFVIAVCFFISKVSKSFNLALDKSLYKNNPEALHYQEYIVVAIVAYFTFLILYYHLEFNKIKSKYNYLNEVILTENRGINLPKISFKSETIEKLDEITDEQKTENSLSGNDSVKEDKLEDLYQKIIHCLQSEKPYQCPKFNIRKLAELLETNTTYVSKALNVFGKKNFNQLVNELRIEQVKNDIITNEYQKFTLEYIYTRAGFKQQSTFNRIFKEQTGMTPSDFIDSSNNFELSDR